MFGCRTTDRTNTSQALVTFAVSPFPDHELAREVVLTRGKRHPETGRLVRLIPNHEGDEERTALKALFEYRLCPEQAQARVEWLDIVEGRHLLWAFISSPKRELIRSVLNTLNLEIVKRARPSSVFNFGEASIGNMFLTG